MALGNTATRVIVALIAIPLILGVCIYGKVPFLLFVLGIGVLSFWEFSQMVKNKNIFVNISFGILSVSAIIFNSYYSFVDFLLLVIIISTVLLLFELFRNKESAILNVGTTLLGIFYLGLFSSTILLIREYFSGEMFYSEGGFLIISIMISIWVCDSAAFFLGTAFGKHKLFPRVSPNKSWEGAIAGFIFAVITMIVAKALFLEMLTLTDVIVIGLIVGIIGQLGDLVESLIKRDSGVKDSSTIIPGHGGIFDRFDSLMLTAPFIYTYLQLIIL